MGYVGRLGVWRPAGDASGMGGGGLATRLSGLLPVPGPQSSSRCPAHTDPSKPLPQPCPLASWPTRPLLPYPWAQGTAGRPVPPPGHPEPGSADRGEGCSVSTSIPGVGEKSWLGHSSLAPDRPLNAGAPSPRPRAHPWALPRDPRVILPLPALGLHLLLPLPPGGLSGSSHDHLVTGSLTAPPAHTCRPGSHNRDLLSASWLLPRRLPTPPGSTQALP